jgi:hypothetical protein
MITAKEAKQVTLVNFEEKHKDALKYFELIIAEACAKGERFVQFTVDTATYEEKYEAALIHIETEYGYSFGKIAASIFEKGETLTVTIYW